MEKEQTIEEQLKIVQTQYEQVVEQNRQLQHELLPFRDKYFKGLSTDIIAQLAKKSIKIGAENTDMQDLISYIAKQIYDMDGEVVNIQRIGKSKYVNAQDFEKVNTALYFINQKIKAYKTKNGVMFIWE